MIAVLESCVSEWQLPCALSETPGKHVGQRCLRQPLPELVGPSRASALDSLPFLCLAIMFYLRCVLEDFALCSGFRVDLELCTFF